MEEQWRVSLSNGDRYIINASYAQRLMNALNKVDVPHQLEGFQLFAFKSEDHTGREVTVTVLLPHVVSIEYLAGG